jgi:hypothetical protein
MGMMWKEISKLEASAAAARAAELPLLLQLPVLGKVLLLVVIWLPAAECGCSLQYVRLNRTNGWLSTAAAACDVPH